MSPDNSYPLLKYLVGICLCTRLVSMSKVSNLFKMVTIQPIPDKTEAHHYDFPVKFSF